MTEQPIEPYDDMPKWEDSVEPTPATFHAKPRKMWPWYTAVGVLSSALVLTGVAFGIVVTGLNDDLNTTEATLTATQTDLTNTQTQLTQARSDATEWENVADLWRECGVASLEISQALLRDGIFAAGLPIGEASARCSAAREANDAATGGGFA
jgi:hypothetical protein